MCAIYLRMQGGLGTNKVSAASTQVQEEADVARGTPAKAHYDYISLGRYARSIHIACEALSGSLMICVTCGLGLQ
jgi:hypothetical protein